MNARNIVLEPRLYHASFLNSFLSEIRKIAYLRSFVDPDGRAGGAL